MIKFPVAFRMVKGAFPSNPLLIGNYEPEQRDARRNSFSSGIRNMTIYYMATHQFEWGPFKSIVLTPVHKSHMLSQPQSIWMP